MDFCKTDISSPDAANSARGISKSESRNPKQIQSTNYRKPPTDGAFPSRAVLVIWIWIFCLCFGFRTSSFELPALTFCKSPVSNWVGRQSGLSSQAPRLKIPAPAFPAPDSRIPSPGSRFPAPGSRIPEPAKFLTGLLTPGKLTSAAKCPRGRNSVVECQLPKLDVEGSNPFARLPRRSRKAKPGCDLRTGLFHGAPSSKSRWLFSCPFSGQCGANSCRGRSWKAAVEEAIGGRRG